MSQGRRIKANPTPFPNPATLPALAVVYIWWRWSDGQAEGLKEEETWLSMP